MKSAVLSIEVGLWWCIPDPINPKVDRQTWNMFAGQLWLSPSHGWWAHWNSGKGAEHKKWTGEHWECTTAYHLPPSDTGCAQVECTMPGDITADGHTMHHTAETRWCWMSSKINDKRRMRLWCAYFFATLSARRSEIYRNEERRLNHHRWCRTEYTNLTRHSVTHQTESPYNQIGIHIRITGIFGKRRIDGLWVCENRLNRVMKGTSSRAKQRGDRSAAHDFK